MFEQTDKSRGTESRKRTERDEGRLQNHDRAAPPGFASRRPLMLQFLVVSLFVLSAVFLADTCPEETAALQIRLLINPGSRSACRPVLFSTSPSAKSSSWSSNSVIDLFGCDLTLKFKHCKYTALKSELEGPL